MLNLKTFQVELAKIKPDYHSTKFLLAISGGVDSMVLFNLFNVLNLSFEVAHINYNLREKDSENDQLLTEKRCREYNIPFHLKKVTAHDNQPKNSIQNWARDLRYDFFRIILKEKKLDYIVTAHHLNDELETFIINLSKASGIKGLSGIPSKQNSILRPLLKFSKTEIYDFACENKIQFREDASNQKNDYLRNRIRNEIAPKLLETNENFLENFGKSLSYLKDTRIFLEDKILEIEKEIISTEKDFIIFHKDLFLRQSDFVQFEILRKFGFIDSGEIKKIKKAETGKIFISSDYHLIVDRKILILQKIVDIIESAVEKEIVLHINGENAIIFPKEIQLQIKELGNLNWEIDKKNIQTPLILRRNKEGDVFYPIGMTGKKKIGKFFRDEKISIFDQLKIWLLCDGNGDILGIIPFRQDKRFVATEKSDKITASI